jgi:hypothetical protein
MIMALTNGIVKTQAVYFYGKGQRGTAWALAGGQFSDNASAPLLEGVSRLDHADHRHLRNRMAPDFASASPA